MSDIETLYSPKQVAFALGVSESSVKRWCDKGKIKMARSAGGHRRMRIIDVVEFIRQSDHNLIAPESLGLARLEIKPEQIENVVTPAVEALLGGDGPRFQAILTGLYLARISVSDIFDRVVSPAFHEIGTLWECENAEVYQERRSCEICIRGLTDLRKLQPKSAGSLRAIGGTLVHDNYQIPATLAELVLQDAGIDASLLGSSIPASSFVAAIDDLQPDLVWLSTSHIEDESEFLREFNLIAARCVEKKIALVVGGRAWTSELRKQG